MVTGYDHLLFLVGIIFFLYRMKDIGLYVSLFAIGHSVTMLIGVYYNISMNAYIIDAIIGFSIVYKALDNLGAYQRWFGFQPNTKAATLIFGLIHGFGLAVKIQEYEVPADGLLGKPHLIQCRGRIRSIYGFSDHFAVDDDVEKNALFLQNSLSKQCLFNVPRFFTCWLSTYWLHYSIRI
jgi:hypothetical protein